MQEYTNINIQLQQEYTKQEGALNVFKTIQ
jgi:hypothetical protein